MKMKQLWQTGYGEGSGEPEGIAVCHCNAFLLCLIQFRIFFSSTWVNNDSFAHEDYLEMLKLIFRAYC